MLPGPQGRYMTANIFASGGGYVGVIDVKTKEAVGLFRATATDVVPPGEQAGPAG